MQWNVCMIITSAALIRNLIGPISSFNPYPHVFDGLKSLNSNNICKSLYNNANTCQIINCFENDNLNLQVKPEHGKDCNKTCKDTKIKLQTITPDITMYAHSHKNGTQKMRPLIQDVHYVTEGV